MAQPSTPTPTPAPAPTQITIDFNMIQTWLPRIAQYYTMFKWILPLIGLDVPPEADAILTTIASQGNVTPETIEKLKQTIQTKPAIGEPVLTRQLAETAYILHKEGMSLRDIAEEFTKQGNPCSHATIAKWVNMIDAEKRASKMRLLIMTVKYASIAVAIALAFFIGYVFF